MQTVKPIYIALGANLSNPKETFTGALKALAAQGVTVKAVSSLWQSPAWPAGSGQPDYVNACASIDWQGGDSDADARALLDILHTVERDFGRIRGADAADRNAARTLDLDLLDYRGICVSTTDIDIPHPRMLERGFVLFPLREIAPTWYDPHSGQEIMDFIALLPLSDVAPMQWLGRW